MPEPKKFNPMDVSSAELDQTIEDYIVGAGDYDVLQEQMNHVMKQMQGSKLCKLALETARQHIIHQGPDHVDCGLRDTACAMFVVGCLLMQKRMKAAPEINELEKLYGLPALEEPSK